MTSTNIIQLDNVSVFQQRNLILSNISFEINKGEFVYLIGRTGSGKSTLMKTLYGEIPIAQGTATVAGYVLYNIKDRDVPFLRRKLGIVFQDFQLLTDRTVNENLEFVLKATGWKDKIDTQQRIREVLENVGLGTKGFKMPTELSGGEQQRVVIARALLNHPDLIIADEPTGNLDPDTSDDIMRLLIQISKAGCAVMMATHNHEFLTKYPARILRVELGRVIDSKNQIRE